MAIDKQTVAKIARLARIEVSEADKTHYAEEISHIIQWVEQLSEVDTEGVPQMVSVVHMALPMRADVVTDGNQPEAVVQNAPASDYMCYVVPKVIE